MNVLYVNHTVQRSGAGISLRILIENLSSEFHPYFFFNYKIDKLVETWFRSLGYNTKRVRYMPHFSMTMYSPRLPLHLFIWQIFKVPISFANILSARKFWKIDLIHLNESTMLAYLFSAIFLRIPAVMHFRTSIDSTQRFGIFLLRIACFWKNWAIICIDNEVKNTLPRCCRNRAMVIYNPIEPGKEPTPQQISFARNSWGVSEHEILIGQVGSLHNEKGIWEFMSIAEHLCPKYPHLKFVLIGDDSPSCGEGPKLHQRILSLGLQKRIILAGYHSNLPVAYAAMNICLCLFGKSLGGSGRSAYEAGIAGKPVIATLPDPHNTTTFRNKITAILHKPNELPSVIQSIEFLIKNPEHGKLLGLNAKKYLTTRHYPSKSANEVEIIYKKLL